MSGPIESERVRIRGEYERRRREVPPDLYAPWQVAEIYLRTACRRVAFPMLHEAGAFPGPGDDCLEIGHARMGWLGELTAAGISQARLHGIELDEVALRAARETFPGADLRGGDASRLPWPDESFRLVIASTLFSSILAAAMRRAVAAEIERVLLPGGALLWYDLAVNNPRNPNVRKITRVELRRLFPRLRGSVVSSTLAPPLARLIAPRSWALAAVLESVPWLRTHLIGVLVKSRE